MLRLFLITTLALTLAACGSMRHSDTLAIDRSVEAQAHNNRIHAVVLHYTAADKATSFKVLTGTAVSSHYLITDDDPPVIYQLVDEQQRAWHAGAGEWYGRNDINTSSIGIEIVHPGKKNEQWVDYNQAQIDQVVLLLKDILSRYDIAPENVVGHSDIAPQRKLDPGPKFPWKTLAHAGIGRWFSEQAVTRALEDYEKEGVPDIEWAQKKLKRLGYGIPQTGKLDKATHNVIAAFQMHYRPHKVDGKLDAETAAIIEALS